MFCPRCGNRSSLFVLFCPLLTVVLVVLQIFEGVMNLLDRLKAWHSTPGSPGNTELKEMAQIGLRIITGYIQQQHSPVSATVSPRARLPQPKHLTELCRKHNGRGLQYLFNLIRALSDKAISEIPGLLWVSFQTHCSHSSFRECTV